MFAEVYKVGTTQPVSAEGGGGLVKVWVSTTKNPTVTIAPTPTSTTASRPAVLRNRLIMKEAE